MSRTLEVFEHGTLHVGDGPNGLSVSEFDHLVRFNDVHRGRYFEVGHRRITMKSYVGYVEVGALAIEILPKADRGSTARASVWRDGLLEMLRVALGLRLEQPSTATQTLSKLRLLDLVALGFLAELEPLLHHGLAKGYRAEQGNGSVFRGRLQVAAHVRENVVRADRFFVEYQAYDQDIAVNRVLGAALAALDDCALSAHVASRVAACVAQFPQVRIDGVTLASLDRLRLTRATQRYASALVYARMILGHQGPQLQAGRDRVFALLFDMNALWERYVAALIRRAAGPNIAVSTQERHYFWHPRTHSARTVRPDIVVRETADDGRGRVLLVIDTKWKVPPKGLPSDEDLKQMFVYNELLGGARSILLYPATEVSFAAAGGYAQRSHGCEQLHLGVVGPRHTWSTSVLREQIAELILECSATATTRT